MIIIRLFCAGGFSTGILMKRMEEVAQKRNLNVNIRAYGVYQMEKILDTETVDVALIGPQVGFELPKIKRLCDAKGVPFEIIPSLDYGRLNGDKVLDLALQIVNK
jgi:PTS system cellobiose-specific IIB component